MMARGQSPRATTRFIIVFSLSTFHKQRANSEKCAQRTLASRTLAAPQHDLYISIPITPFVERISLKHHPALRPGISQTMRNMRPYISCVLM